MRRRPWENRSVVVALVLAILVPGLGHLFQGRFLKGLIYFCGILGLFVWGVQMGEGVVVYNLPEKPGSRRITLTYAAQLGTGAISYPVYWQQKRALQESNRDLRQLTEPLTAPFSGTVRSLLEEASSGKLEGTVKLAPATGESGTETKGTFTGTLDEKPVEFVLGGRFELDRPIAAGFRRTLICGIQGDGIGESAKTIEGTVPRPIADGYGISPTLPQLLEITGRLGKLHELAVVFTCVAGLLNILAIWDCVQGPAYGFGDESYLVGGGHTNL